MEKDLARDILEHGFQIYSNTSSVFVLSNWCKSFRENSEERDFADFCLRYISEMNSRGASYRLFGLVNDRMREDILKRYFS